jgi:hypothetical protein
MNLYGNIFLDTMHVKDTIVLTLKEKISFILSHYKLHIQIIKGQGFNGAINICG